MRGFKERSIGPQDSANGQVTGGKSELLMTAEFITPIYEKTLFYALFVDAGNVWQDSYEVHPSELNVGAGMGIRIHLPIGAFTLDYGWPIVRDQPDVSTSGRLHFNLGYTF